MSDKKRKKTLNGKKKSDDGSKSSDTPSEQSSSSDNKQKKGKRFLRFTLPEPSPSEESFTSAVSSSLEDEDNQEPVSELSEISILKKYVMIPMRHSQPRRASPKPCFSESVFQFAYKEQESNVFLSAASSSKQLFEILRHSPTPSDADMDLINATYLRRLERVKEAIDNGANVNTFRDRQSPLLIAAEIGDERLVEFLLSVPNINPDFQNAFGQTPLLIAVRNTFDKIIKLLLNHNADVNVSDNMGKTPLHAALFQRRLDLAKLLLAYGADHEKQDCFGERPIYTSAVKKPDLNCLILLLKVGASPENSHVTGISLLSRAIMNWTDFCIIETLVKYGASVNSRDFNSGKTPLHFAAIINDAKIAKFLYIKGADPHAKTFYDFTPFQEAVFHKSLEVAQFLARITRHANLKALATLLKEREKKSSL